MTYFLYTDQWILKVGNENEMQSKYVQDYFRKHLSTYITKQILKFEGALRYTICLPKNSVLPRTPLYVTRTETQLKEQMRV